MFSNFITRADSLHFKKNGAVGGTRTRTPFGFRSSSGKVYHSITTAKKQSSSNHGAPRETRTPTLSPRPLKPLCLPFHHRGKSSKSRWCDSNAQSPDSGSGALPDLATSGLRRLHNNSNFSAHSFCAQSICQNAKAPIFGRLDRKSTRLNSSHANISY